MSHVLVIEDEPFIALLISETMMELGATSIAFAATQQEAIAAALDRVPDLITSDVRLREGTGPLAVAAIRDRLGPIPVVFITASPDDCIPVPVDASIITKPFVYDTLSTAVREWVQ